MLGAGLQLLRDSTHRQVPPAPWQQLFPRDRLQVAMGVPLF